jgi:predicted DNA-binding transcriptional regulator AlpA
MTQSAIARETRPIPATELELLGVAELVELTGLRQGTISGYVMRNKMPKPDVTLAAGPVWKANRRDLQEWINSRKPG